MTDNEREMKIQCAVSGIEAAMDAWEQSGNFADRGRADGYRLIMEALIRERSAKKVASMESELGFSK